MKLRSPKNTKLVFILLAGYIYAQFMWWTFLLIRYNPEKKWMVLGEGAVFMVFLGLGIYTIYRTIRHEIGLAKMQKNFLLSVTHELKTPVAAGKLFLQTLLRHDFDKAKKEELLHKAVNENDRLTALIDKVILATTLDSHQIPLTQHQHSLSAISEEICKTTTESTGAQHSWEINIQPGINFTCDAESMRSIWQNLLENAIKYSPPQSLIQASLSQSGNKIELSVSDQGSGIKKADLPFIFNKFYRSGNEETRSAKGTGLGLFIVKHLVTLHHGQINYKAKTPAGSIFTVIFNVN